MILFDSVFEYRFPIWSMLGEQTEAFIKIHSSFSVDLDFFGLSGISKNVIFVILIRIN